MPPQTVDDSPALRTGPLLLVAGPGTGKTHDIARRVKWLVSERDPRVDPRDITVVAFTTEAARNTLKRMNDPEKKDVRIPPVLQPRVCTTHALGNDILREHGESVGIPREFDVLQSGAIRDVLMHDAAMVLDAGDAVARDAADCRQKGDCRQNLPCCAVCNEYKRIIRAFKHIDHDDQILEANRALALNVEALTTYQHRARHLLVDEFQDINPAQFELIERLSANSREGLFAVGDDDQSIYEFRGGSCQYMTSFADRFPGCSIAYKNVSFRCPEHVLQGALGVVERNCPTRNTLKPAITCRTGGDPIHVHRFPSDFKEAAFIADLARRESIQSDVLILVPTAYFAPMISKALESRGIAHSAPIPWRNMHLSILRSLTRWIDDHDRSLDLRLCMQAMADSGYLGIPGPRARADASVAERRTALAQIASLWTRAIDSNASLWETASLREGDSALVASIVEAMRVLEFARSTGPSEYFDCINTAFAPWGDNAESMSVELSDWMRLAGQGTRSPSVRIMTMDGAKGLEAGCVVLVGADEGVLPASPPNGNDEPLESRKFFVAMTRTKRVLHICHSVNRSATCTLSARTLGMTQSRFINAIAAAHKTYENHP